MHQQPNKQRKPYRGQGNSYVAPFARFEYQIDIMDMVSLQKQTNQPRYALVVIDIFSKLGVHYHYITRTAFQYTMLCSYFL